MFERLRLWFVRLAPTEKRLLDEVGSLLTDTAGDRFRKQIEAVNKVQRLQNWTEMNFYSMRNGRILWNPEILFADKEEFKMAEIKFRIGDTEFEASLISVTGHVFSLIVRPSLQGFAFSKDITVLTKELLKNPDSHSSENIIFPESYLRWNLMNDRKKANGWDVLTPSESYLISLEEEDYRILAVRGANSEYLLSRDKTEASAIYYISSEDEQVKLAKTDFSESLKR